MTIELLPGSEQYEIRQIRKASGDALIEALGFADDSMIRKWENPTNTHRPLLEQYAIMDRVYMRESGNPPLLFKFYKRLLDVKDEASTSFDSIRLMIADATVLLAQCNKKEIEMTQPNSPGGEKRTTGELAEFVGELTSLKDLVDHCMEMAMKMQPEVRH